MLEVSDPHVLMLFNSRIGALSGFGWARERRPNPVDYSHVETSIGTAHRRVRGEREWEDRSDLVLLWVDA